MSSTCTQFTVNGKEFSAQNPNQLLIDFLHEEKLTGTKLVCGEGGCGACTVMVDKGENGKIAINSCLRPVGLCGGLDIVTIEGLKNESEETKDVRNVIAKFGGSQCGFCTPGFCMTMESYKDTCTSKKQEMQEQDIEDLFSGNLCRCTGYRPILCGYKTFAVGGNKEELKNTPPLILDESKGYANNYEEHEGVSTVDFLEQGTESLKLATPPNLALSTNQVKLAQVQTMKPEWIQCQTEQEALDLIKNNNKDFKIVCGNTSMGIYKDEEWRSTQQFINISHIRELQYVRVSDDAIRIGATVTLAQLMDTIKEQMEKRPTAKNLPVIYNHMRRIAGIQVRNAGSVAGNLVMAWKRNFVSDLFVALATSKARVIAKKWVSGVLTKMEYPLLNRRAAKGDLMSEKDTSTFVSEVIIPFIASKDDLISTYKVAKRLQNSHALVNAGFRFSKDGVKGPYMIVGNLAARITELKETEEYIQKNNIDWHKKNEVAGVLSTLKKELETIAKGTEAAGPIEERVTIALNLFYKFIVEKFQITTDVRILHSIQSTYLQRKKKRSQGKQQFFVDTNEGPISEPIIKISALNQARGEAVYTQTQPIPDDCLHAAFVQSNRATGTIQSFHSNPVELLFAHFKERYDMVLDPAKTFIYTYLSPELVKGGANMLSGKNSTFKEYLLANEEVVYYGQAVALVVAQDDWVAKEAAKFLFSNPNGFITYAESYKPLLSLKSSINKSVPVKANGNTNLVNTLFVGPNIEFITNLEIKDDKPPQIAWDKYSNDPQQYVIVEGVHETGSQYHFYMETQSSLAIPDTNGQHITLYSSTQSHMSLKGICQSLISKATGNNIQVTVKITQVGGGFGGKEPQSKFTAAGATLVAALLNKPVRLVLDRNSDMRMIGKRHPFQGDFKLAARKADGRIEAMCINYRADAGVTYDATLPIMDLALLTADNAYNVKEFVASGKCYFTNKATGTAFRSFGVVQSHQITEYAIEKLCEALPKLSPFEIRANNFYKNEPGAKTPYDQEIKHCNLDGIWDAIDARMSKRPKSDSDSTDIQDIPTKGQGYADAVKRINDFNITHKWKKRGISVLPLKYGISFTSVKMNRGQAEITIKSDGHIDVVTGGVEMGQGIDTKMRQIAAFKLGLKSTLVNILPFNSDFVQTIDGVSIPGTGASTGTDLNGGAVSNAAGKIRTELFEKYLKDDTPGSLWDRYVKNGSRWYVPAKYSDGHEVKPEINLWDEAVEKLKPQLPFKTWALYQSPDLVEVDLKTKKGSPFYYFNYAAAFSEVEIDVLTGEFNILKSEIIYDAGISINPAIDIGQIEGGFVQGIGYVTTEELEFDDLGRLTTDGTWEYKLPSTTEIPMQFNVSMYPTLEEIEKIKHMRPWERRDKLDQIIDPYGIQSSKTTGEPPLVLANAVFFAIRDAVKRFRKQELKDSSTFDFPSPATTFRIQQACSPKSSDWVNVLLGPTTNNKQ